MHTKTLIWITFTVLMTLNSGAESVFVPGLVFMKAHPSQAAEFWTPIPFESYEKFGVSVSVKTKEGRDVVINNEKLGFILEEPNFNSVTIITDEDWSRLDQARQNWERKLKEFPQAKVFIKSVLTSYVSMLENKGLSKVYVQGKWMSEREYKAYLDTFKTGGKKIAILEVAGKKYTNVTVTSCRDGKIGIAHDAGVARIEMTALNERQLANLKETAPDKFPVNTIASTPQEKNLANDSPAATGRVVKATDSKSGYVTIADLEKRANQGDARSAALLSRQFDGDTRYKWALQAAEAKDPIGILMLAICFMNGDGVAVDESKGNKLAEDVFSKVSQLADSGDVVALSCTGFCYLRGFGVDKNESLGIQLTEQAAVRGDAVSKTNMGTYLQSGIGTPKDEGKALEWFLKAANQGDALGQFALGGCYQSGAVAPQNDRLAFEWYEKAAAQGHGRGQYSLGGCYEKGIGTSIDGEKAVELYKESVAQGYANAQVLLGFCYQKGTGVDKDEEKAYKLFAGASVKGYAPGHVALASCYLDGRGTAKDEVRAFMLFEKAAAQGEANGQAGLGLCYLNGLGVSQDVRKAAVFYEQAAAQGNIVGQRGLLSFSDEQVAKINSPSLNAFRSQFQLQIKQSEVAATKAQNETALANILTLGKGLLEIYLTIKQESEYRQSATAQQSIEQAPYNRLLPQTGAGSRAFVIPPTALRTTGSWTSSEPVQPKASGHWLYPHESSSGRLSIWNVSPNPSTGGGTISRGLSGAGTGGYTQSGNYGTTYTTPTGTGGYMQSGPNGTTYITPTGTGGYMQSGPNGTTYITPTGTGGYMQSGPNGTTYTTPTGTGGYMQSGPNGSTYITPTGTGGYMQSGPNGTTYTTPTGTGGYMQSGRH